MGPLDSQVAVVTGGANGIGRACALRFAHEGADVVIADLLDDAGADAAGTVEDETGRRAIFVHLDATSKADNERVADAAVDAFGRLDVLVTAAGISHGGYRSGDLDRELERAKRGLGASDGRPQAFCAVDIADWRRVLDVNLTGTFLAVQAAASRMIEHEIAGRIVTISSIGARHPDGGGVAYTASKAGVWMLTKKAARELAPAGIRVNSIGPGVIATNMSAVLDHAPARREQLMTAVPLGRLGAPDEVAATALFLATDESSYFTGQLLHPDGGFFTG